jgi:hypothetical protein
VKKRLLIVLGSVLLMGLTAAAQNVKQQSPANPPDEARKIVTISGLVGPDGKTFTSLDGKTVWAVANPEVLLDSVGEQVRVRARVDAQNHEIHVGTVRIDPTLGARIDDAAFRR